MKTKSQKLSTEAGNLKKNIEKCSTEGPEPAWKVLKNTPELYVWRIEKFKLVLIEKPFHGTFYDGDSYIILNAYMNSRNKLSYDVFIWIGKHSTSDEYGTAAYKMVELDMDILKDAAIQHREIESNESHKFLQLFSKMTVLRGGVSSGFNQVKTGKPDPVLLHISGEGKNILVKEISYKKENLTEHDVFIVDLDDTVYQINGKKCSKDEKFKGASVLSEIKSKRGKVKTEVIDDFESGLSHPVIDAMPLTHKPKKEKVQKAKREFSLWRLSDKSGKMEMKEVSRGKCLKSSLDTKDVFIFDASDQIFVWVGKKTSRQERLGAISYAQKYAQNVGDPLVTLTSLTEGNENDEFKSFLKF